MADLSKIILLDGSTYDFKDATARSSLSTHVTNTNNPHSVTASQVGAAIALNGIYFGRSNTSASVLYKSVTINLITSTPTVGIKIRVVFTYAQLYNGTPYLTVYYGASGSSSLAPLPIITASYSDGSLSLLTYADYNAWGAGACLDLLLISIPGSSTNVWIILNHLKATDSLFGITLLSDSLTASTNESADDGIAASASAINLLALMLTGVDIFSTSSTYSVGDRVRYGTSIYECKSTISTPGSWNSSNWDDLGSLLSMIDLIKTKLVSFTDPSNDGNIVMTYSDVTS